METLNFTPDLSITADLSITNTAPGNVNSGAILTYTITVTNGGPNQADSIFMKNTIPTGTTFNSVSTTAGSCKSPLPGGIGMVTCKVSLLVKGGSFTVTLAVNVTAPSGSTINDQASVKTKTFDPVASNNKATATTKVN